MLFYQTTQRVLLKNSFLFFTQIKKVEFFHLKKETDYFQFKELVTIKQSPADRLIDYLKEKFYNKKIVGVKKITYQRNSKNIFYKGKYYHDLDKECFYSIVYPYSYFDKILNIYYRNFGKFD
jgi:hypothetical protein